MAGEDLEVGEGLVVPGGEIRERASRSSGPGGQHVNKSSTRVTLRWNVARSDALDARRRTRLLARLGSRLTASGDLVVHAQASRSRTRNRDAARARMAEIISHALRDLPSRVATRPSRAARERRLRDKQRRSSVKRDRRTRSEGDP